MAEDISGITEWNTGQNVLRKTALFLANQAKTGRWSKKKMMFRAAMNPLVLLDFLFPEKQMLLPWVLRLSTWYRSGLSHVWKYLPQTRQPHFLFLLFAHPPVEHRYQSRQHEEYQNDCRESTDGQCFHDLLYRWVSEERSDHHCDQNHY